jgi:hypothetical protein
MSRFSGRKAYRGLIIVSQRSTRRRLDPVSANPCMERL